MKFKQHKENKDFIACSSCGSVVPTIKIKNYNNEDEYNCKFCFESVGNPHSEISKQLLANMFNTLLQELNGNKK